jgi:hypothetical protein
LFDISAEFGGEGAEALIEDFTRAQFFKTGLRYLEPGQEMVSDYSQITEKFEQKIESVIIFSGVLIWEASSLCCRPTPRKDTTRL